MLRFSSIVICNLALVLSSFGQQYSEPQVQPWTSGSPPRTYTPTALFVLPGSSPPRYESAPMTYQQAAATYTGDPWPHAQNLTWFYEAVAENNNGVLTWRLRLKGGSLPISQTWANPAIYTEGSNWKINESFEVDPAWNGSVVTYLDCTTGQVVHQDTISNGTMSSNFTPTSDCMEMYLNDTLIGTVQRPNSGVGPDLSDMELYGQGTPLDISFGPGITGVGTSSINYQFSYVSGGGTPGAVGSVSIVNGGSGYTSAPSVTFVGGGGTGAAGTALVSGGRVIGINMSSFGSGYTSPPTVVFQGGSGTGASSTVYLSSPGIFPSQTVIASGTMGSTLTTNIPMAPGAIYQLEIGQPTWEWVSPGDGMDPILVPTGTNWVTVWTNIPVASGNQQFYLPGPPLPASPAPSPTYTNQMPQISSPGSSSSSSTTTVPGAGTNEPASVDIEDLAFTNEDYGEESVIARATNLIDKVHLGISNFTTGLGSLNDAATSIATLSPPGVGGSCVVAFGPYSIDLGVGALAGARSVAGYLVALTALFVAARMLMDVFES